MRCGLHITLVFMVTWIAWNFEQRLFLKIITIIITVIVVIMMMMIMVLNLNCHDDHDHDHNHQYHNDHNRDYYNDIDANVFSFGFILYPTHKAQGIIMSLSWGWWYQDPLLFKLHRTFQWFLIESYCTIVHSYSAINFIYLSKEKKTKVVISWWWAWWTYWSSAMCLKSILK